MTTNTRRSVPWCALARALEPRARETYTLLQGGVS